MFLLTDRSACLAISNQPSLSEIKAAGPNSPVNITAYDQGVCIKLWRACRIILTYVFLSQTVHVRYHLSSVGITLATKSCF